jgi:hypothetical protein
MFGLKVLVIHRFENDPKCTCGTDTQVVEMLKQLLEKIDFLTLKINEIMTKQERFDGILTRLDAVTTDIAGDFKTFVQEVKDGTVSDESLTRAEENISKLEQVAASKENPVPGEVTPQVTEGEGSQQP